MPARDVDVLAIEDALAKLEALSPRQARIVEMRCLLGLSVQETAEALELSERTVHAEWRLARAWLARELSDERRAPRATDRAVRRGDRAAAATRATLLERVRGEDRDARRRAAALLGRRDEHRARTAARTVLTPALRGAAAPTLPAIPGYRVLERDRRGRHGHGLRRRAARAAPRGRDQGAARALARARSRGSAPRRDDHGARSIIRASRACSRPARPTASRSSSMEHVDGVTLDRHVESCRSTRALALFVATVRRGAPRARQGRDPSRSQAANVMVRARRRAWSCSISASRGSRDDGSTPATDARRRAARHAALHEPRAGAAAARRCRRAHATSTRSA